MSGKKSKARRRQLLSNAVRVENIWEEHSYLVGRCACGGDLVAIRFELVRGPAVTHERCEARCACCLRRHNILFDVSEIFRNGRPLEVQDWYATAWPPVTQGPYARRERELEIKLRGVTEEASFSQLTSEQMQQAIGKVYREHGARLLGRYEVLGARTGAFGQVYLCLDTAADSRMVVCKLAVSSENVDLESIRREASVWLGLGEHPNIVSLYDIKTRTEHQVVLVLEAVHPGPQGRTTLSDWIKAKALREQEKRSILGGVVAGMLYCHERISGFVHADLKPENILISHGFRAKITDFGLARASAMPGLPLGQGFGTPLYLAPECWDSRPPSEASDVYAFGLLAIETLTGKHPFEQSTDRDARRRRHEGGVSDACFVALSEEEARLLRRAVDPDPSHRPRFSDLATVFPVPKYPAARDTEFVTQWNANDRGTALLALGRHPEAIAEFAKALRPESPALMNIATSASQAGLVELANAAYTTLLNGNPHPQARANYAAHVLRYAVREKYEEGLQQCDKCLEVDPRNLTALSNKAALLNSLERYEEAFDAAEAARSIDPKMPQAQFELAWAASKLNRYSKALSTAKDIVRNYPEFERAAELLRSLENQKKRK